MDPDTKNILTQLLKCTDEQLDTMVKEVQALLLKKGEELVELLGEDNSQTTLEEIDKEIDKQERAHEEQHKKVSDNNARIEGEEKDYISVGPGYKGSRPSWFAGH